MTTLQEVFGIMGPDKKKVIEYFPVSQFISGTRGQEIEKLWKEFFWLYKILRKPFLLDQEINAFEIDAKNWIRNFYRVTEGHPNSVSQKPGLYRKQDVTYASIYVPIKDEKFITANFFYF